jgi:hypothetical protein
MCDAESIDLESSSLLMSRNFACEGWFDDDDDGGGEEEEDHDDLLLLLFLFHVSGHA